MFTYYKLNKYIARQKPKTISVDIFDTLLLRKNRSEKWHFWKFSKEASSVFKSARIKCSPLLYFSLRNYYNKVLRDANHAQGYDYEASIDSVNAEIVTEIFRRRSKKLTKDKLSDLCQKLVQAEIDFECSELTANHKLVDILTSSKIPVYFVTDMYFTSNQIASLILHLGVSLTVNGISSADYLVGKSSGRSFAKLMQKYPNIKTNTNLHIGDHKQADINIPRKIGADVFWLNLPAHRIKMFVTKYVFGLYLTQISKLAIKRSYKQASKNLNLRLKRTKKQIEVSKLVGEIFGAGLIYYTHYLSTYSKATNTSALLVSGESAALSQIIDNLGFDRPATLPKFGRKLLLQSYCYLQNQKGVSYFSMLKMVKKVQRRKSNFEALITLGITSADSSSYQLLSHGAYQEYLVKNEKTITKQLKKSYLTVMRDFKKVIKTKDLNTVLVGDVGWNNTIQILLNETLKNSNYSGQLRGMYLGLTGTNVFDQSIQTNSQGILFNSLRGTSAYLYQPEVWESFLNTDNVGNPIRSAILNGVASSVVNYKHSELSPLDFYLQSHKLLLKTLAAPSKKIIQVFSGLQFDYGTGNEVPVPMVDTTHSKLFAYKLLIRRRGGFKTFYHDNGWKWGAASHYHFRLLYRLWRKKARKPSF